MDTGQTVTEQLGISDKQKERFSLLCQRINMGDINPNQAYQWAQANGQDEDDPGFKGSFKDWMIMATQNGWLQQQKPIEPVQEAEPPKKPSVLIPILVGVALAGFIYVMIKRSKNKDS